jgi:hypothetical protein
MMGSLVHANEVNQFTNNKNKMTINDVQKATQAAFYKLITVTTNDTESDDSFNTTPCSSW